MFYPSVRQLGSLRPNAEQRRIEDWQARKIALRVRRRQELELQRDPVLCPRSRPIRDDGRSRVARGYAAAVTALVLAVVIVYAVAANVGAS
jgi:hypothetical protein